MSLSPISPTHREDLDGKEDALEVIESGADQSADEEIEEQQARVVKNHMIQASLLARKLRNTFQRIGHSGLGADIVRGRGVASPHKSRSQEDKEFPQGRNPTISIDHCFLGSEKSEDMAHGNPFLIFYDNQIEGIFAISVASKATKPWIVKSVKDIIYELGYGEIKICLKSDGARELHELRRAVAGLRMSL